MNDFIVQLNDVSKQFDGHLAVNELCLDIKRGEFLTLLGPSGCGKTTTLRMIAGFDQPTSGDILINGKHVEGTPPYARDVNTVFQSYALFPHMNVFDNIAFGLRLKKVKKEDVKKRVLDALKLVQLEGFEGRKPDQLSGGQKQRIAIARALVNNPQVLLLDEPLGALDLKLRKQMQVELKHLQQQLGITFVYVTHDQEEALTMSDRIAVMNKGVLEQIGTANEIYENPKSRFVADFIGETNLFEGTVVGFNGKYAYMHLGESVSQIPIPKVDSLQLHEKVYMAIRPERAKILTQPDDSDLMLSGTFVERIYVGSVTKTIVSLPNGQKVTVNEHADELQHFQAGHELYVSWAPDRSVVMKA